MADVLSTIELNRVEPLVVETDSLPDGSVGYEFFIRSADDYRPVYDFYCRDAEDAIKWLAHLSHKSWVEKSHLSLFAEMAHAQFGAK